MVASMGASSILLFLFSNSPAAQPRSLLGGHLVSAAVGVTCAAHIPDPSLASAVAIASAILAMGFFSCVHPPGGATALSAVVGGEQVLALGYQYVLVPVTLNALIVLIVGGVLVNLFPGKSYPIRSQRCGDRRRRN